MSSSNSKKEVCVDSSQSHPSMNGSRNEQL